MALVATRLRLRRVTAVRQAKRLLHGCMNRGRRTTTYNIAKPAMEQFLGFHLVQVPDVPVDKIERVSIKWGLEDKILLIREIANNIVVEIDNRLNFTKIGSKVLFDYQILHT